MRLLKKLFKYLFFLLIAFIAVIVAAFWFIDSRLYTSYIEKQIVEAARLADINLALKNSRLSYNNFSADSIEIFSPKTMLSLNVSEFNTSVSWLKLLSSIVAGNIQSKLYDGTFKSDLEYQMKNGQARIDAEVKDVAVSQYPLISSLGINSGKLNATIDKFEMQRNKIVGGTLNADLKDLNKPMVTKFKVFVQNVPIDIKIPAFQNLEANLAARFGEKDIQIDSFSSKSSLFEIDLDGLLGLEPNNRIGNLNLNSKVELSPEGVKELGPYLPLLSNYQLTENDRSFSVFISGRPNRPTIKFSK